jgi:branched-chain amino acid transport system permease protein
MVSLELVASQLTTGLVIGARLFLVAVGLSLIFGVMDVLNFAHGALFMVGSYTAIAVTDATGSFLLAIGAGILLVGVVGVIIEAGFIRRVYDRGHLDQLLMTFAFVLIITDAVRLIFGSDQKTMASPDLFNFSVPLGVASIPGYRAFIILMSLVVLGGIFAVLKTTGIGRLVRATSSDRDMAALLGVNVPRLYTGVFFVGAALAGFGGALSAPLTSVTTSIGDRAVINAFVIAVIGGLGSFVGAFVGAMLVGVLGAVGSIWIDGAQDVVPFLAMILVLVLKPEGLFGGLEGS